MDAIQDHIKEFIPGDTEYVQAFYKFEMLLDMERIHQLEELTGSTIDPPSAQYYTLRLKDEKLPLEKEYESQGTEWGALQAGFFDGSDDRFLELLDKYKY